MRRQLEDWDGARPHLGTRDREVSRRLVWVARRLVGCAPVGSPLWHVLLQSLGVVPGIGWGWKFRSAFLQASGFGENVCVLEGFFVAYPRNISIGRSCFFNRNVSLTAPARLSIGDDCLFGPNVVVNSGDHRLDRPGLIRLAGHTEAPISIGDNVWIGANVVILQGVTIGAHAVIGAGSIVNRDVEVAQVVAGVPARSIGYRPI